MTRFWKESLAALSLTAAVGISHAQAPAGAPQQPGVVAIPTANVRPTGTAVTVNGQAIPESAVARAMKPVPEKEQAQARPDIVNFLIDNVLIDQYLAALKVPADPVEVAKRQQEFKDEIKKHNKPYEAVLNDLMLTEAELKEQIVGQIRWEKFLEQQATPETLRKMFEANADVFDGSMVRARHILVTPTAPTEAANQAAANKMGQIKAALNKAVENALAKLPATTSPQDRERLRDQYTDEAFVALAKAHSNCPSAPEGGDLNFFPRVGTMVEPFAKAAFALKVGQVSEIVQTKYGYHIILVIGRKPGTPTDFEKVKDAVKEFYEGKLREAVAARMRQQAKIEIASGR